MKVHIPSNLAREFEAMGEPVVTHRLTRFADAGMRAAAQVWLAQQQVDREAASLAAEEEADRRSRRVTAILALAALVGWIFALAILFR